MNFKAQLDRDLTEVFHNRKYHADDLEFWISNTRYRGAVILDDGGAQDRKKPSTSDHVDGLVLIDLVMYVPLSVLKRTPNKGEQVEIGDDLYKISKVHPEAGEIVLCLEGLSEE